MDAVIAVCTGLLVGLMVGMVADHVSQGPAIRRLGKPTTWIKRISGGGK